MTRCEFENFESKLNELMKTCLEMDQLNVGLQDLKPGSRAYEQVLSQIECDARALKAQAKPLEQFITEINGQDDVAA